MKGVIFNLLGEVVQREYREGTRGAAPVVAEFSRNDTSLGSYPDAEMARLARVAAALDVPAAAVRHVPTFDAEYRSPSTGVDYGRYERC
jgi:hypothetical protein